MHTQGKWEVLDAIKIYVQASDADEVICEIPLDYASSFDTTHEHLLANAKLIAASPDLLDACKCMLICFENNTCGKCPGLEKCNKYGHPDLKAKEAIAKATGAG